jgi:hypothetical protein
MSDKKNIQEISTALKLAYRVKAKSAIKELEPHAKKGEYRDLAKNIIKKRQAGIAKSMGEEAVDMGSNYASKVVKTPQEKFKAGLKKAGYDPDAGAKRLLDLMAKQKAERAEHEKKYGHLYGEEVELDEGTFKYHMDKAIAAAARGDEKKKAYHLDNARSAKFAMSTADYAKHQDLLSKHKQMSEALDLSEAMDPEHPIAKEYKAMKQHDIGTLRNMIKGQQKIADVSEYRSKDHAISAYLRHKHGDKKVAAAMGLSEAAWGQDKMSNLRAAHDRHSEKAIAANRAGDHEAVKVHQSKMGMIKTKMNKLRKEDVELDEGKKLYRQEGSFENWSNDAKKAGHTVIIPDRNKNPDHTHHAVNKDGKVVGKFFKATYVNNRKGHLQNEEVDIPVIGADKPTVASITKKKAPMVGKPGPEIRPTPDTTSHSAGVHRFAREETDLDEAAMHRVNVTVSDPNHTMVTQRKEKIQKIVRVKALDKDNALHKANQYYKDRGYRVHGAEHVGMIGEDAAVNEAGPFSYGKPPRKGSIADLAAKKRKEQERGKQPIEPKDQMVGVAKVTKEETQIDELSDTTLKSYIGKATRSIEQKKKDAEKRDKFSKDATRRPSTQIVNAAVRDQIKNSAKQRAYNIGRAAMKIATNEDVNEAWNIGNRNPQRGIKVGHKVRSYDFPGMHDDHYVEGHVVGETSSSYHLRVNKVVRAGKEVPVPAHMVHVEAPKGTGMFNQAYAVHKILDKQNQVAARPEPASGAAKTFSKIRGKQ